MIVTLAAVIRVKVSLVRVIRLTVRVASGIQGYSVPDT